MSHSSARRAQVEPLPALTAVAMLGLALSAHATVLDSVTSDPEARSPAATEIVLRFAVADLREGAVLDPDAVEAAVRNLPDDYRVQLTIRAGEQVWTAGPTPPSKNVQIAQRWLPVRLRPGVVRPGRITVRMW